MSKKGGKDGGGSMDKEKELGKLYKELGALRCSPESHYTEILKVVSAVNTLVLFFCSSCANVWPKQFGQLTQLCLVSGDYHFALC